jgi:YgiT-type zinc finger domain-containing protein
MFTCHVCGSHEASETTVREVFEIRGEPVVVEHIPASVCKQCGEVIFAIDTAEHIRALLASTAKPTRMVNVPVFEFA